MTTQLDLDAKWWRLGRGTKWHRLEVPSNGEAPSVTWCRKVSVFKLRQAHPNNPTGNRCSICARRGE